MFVWVIFGLIFKLVAWTAAAGSSRVTALDDKITDHPVEGNPVIKTFFGQEDKVVDRFGSMFREKLESQSCLCRFP